MGLLITFVAHSGGVADNGIAMKKFLLLPLLILLSFAFFADSASAEDFYFFRIDSELDVPVAIGSGATARWRCNGTGEGIVTDNTASESIQALDGIVKVASTSVENNASRAGCDGGESIVGSVSMDGWRYRNFSGTVTTVGSNITFTVRASMDYTILVNGVTDELGNALTLNGTTASATYSGTVASQSYSGGKRYIAGSTSGGTITGGADGYVNRISSALTISSTATKSVDFGTSDNSSLNESGLSFAYMFTAPTGATVTAGNSFGISCTESGGSYYCAVPVSHAATSAKAVKSGCSDTTVTYTLRTSGATAQQLGTFSMCGGGTPHGRLVIVKLVKGGPLGISAFQLYLDSELATPGEYIKSAGHHIISEEPTPNYSLSFSGDCDAKGYVQIIDGGKVTCTLTNTYTAVEVPSAPTPTFTPNPLPSTAPTPASLGFTSLAALNLNEGDTMSAAGSADPDIYIANEWGYKRLFLNPVLFGFYGHLGGFANVRTIVSSTRDKLVTSGLFRNCETSDPKVYGVETTGEDMGILHWVNTSGEQAVQDDPEFFKKVFCINSNEFSWYSKGSDYTSVIQVPMYSR